MSGRLPAIGIAALAAMLALTLGGCTYDYLQHTDRVAYHAGDAVNANLEAETIDPAKDSAYSTSGLGKNGSVGASTEPPPAE
ncbi:MAG: hypothetical protein HY834_21240 [Devosia nanyangense]|uniref:Uncharacterized protein n=1 Tax=Devosia nanyangense TaxID=1228055 RepID=A0A933L707_9HYPH|nr:hypothetical protein [Devosia nanyangense]